MTLTIEILKDNEVPYFLLEKIQGIFHHRSNSSKSTNSFLSQLVLQVFHIGI
ncbi:hypothetical protein DICPUDRAFT_155072 [Dictyostelium purpureum]|uniref:Uncharacterized protein n=1 Tax=Dictyostelium purpureum TaxID=5786 RepID=F0ZT04_DICPU|nr:uncharacterized protein DICPUDRAFT_155072 [Dictyostelium purpureum]EGC32934.1 hypothetical protein DICPUDRAFT_155072 [Dictyostelium purpureum]|eukprot:XP_003290542.1 hypothetical protein DICPUDRAFT_155072 [Dictyostelium purpureum]